MTGMRYGCSCRCCQVWRWPRRSEDRRQQQVRALQRRPRDERVHAPHGGLRIRSVSGVPFRAPLAVGCSPRGPSQGVSCQTRLSRKPKAAPRLRPPRASVMRRCLPPVPRQPYRRVAFPPGCAVAARHAARACVAGRASRPWSRPQHLNIEPSVCHMTFLLAVCWHACFGCWRLWRMFVLRRGLEKRLSSRWTVVSPSFGWVHHWLQGTDMSRNAGSRPSRLQRSLVTLCRRQLAFCG